MLCEQIESSLASKDEQLKQLEQKKESDIEAARAVLSLAIISTMLRRAQRSWPQVLHNSVDNVEIAHAMVTLIR